MIALVVLLMMSKCETIKDLETVVDKMRMEMNERLALNEEKLMKTQYELRKTQEELILTKNALETKSQELEREVYFLPWLWLCI